MKLVINTCFGGFGLSDAAYSRLIELGIPTKPYKEEWNEEIVIYDNHLSTKDNRSSLFNNRYWETWSRKDNNRNNPLLVQVVEELGEKANGSCASLSVVEIPDNVEYTIEEYDGSEHVAEQHRTWG